MHGAEISRIASIEAARGILKVDSQQPLIDEQGGRADGGTQALKCELNALVDVQGAARPVTQPGGEHRSVVHWRGLNVEGRAARDIRLAGHPNQVEVPIPNAIVEVHLARILNHNCRIARCDRHRCKRRPRPGRQGHAASNG